MAQIVERKGRNGSVTYRARIRIKGGKDLSASFKRKTDAVRWAERIESDIRDGKYFKVASAGKKTVASLIDRYLELEAPKRKDKQLVIPVLELWRGLIGEVTLKDLTPAILAEYRDRLLVSPNEKNKGAANRNPDAGKEKKGPATVVRYMAVLSHAFSLAVREWGWLDSNPMLKVKKPALPQARVRFLSDEERDRLLEVCRESACPYLYPIVVIALSTGARKSEILNLRWKDIDLKRGIAQLELTKNRDRRALPLTHHAKELVQALHEKAKPERNDFLFPRADGMAPFTIQKVWYQAVREADLEDFHFHDLRHSAASYLAMNGATLAEIAEVLGHKTLQMVKRYAHLSDQHVAKVVERMNRKIFKSGR